MKPKLPRRPADRWLAVLLAVLVQLVWPIAAWHEATSVHAICPEHGEVLELAAAADCDGDHEEQHWTGSEDNGEHHERCPLGVLAQPSSHAEAAVPCTARFVAAVEIVEPTSSRHAPIPLLLEAPKHSPPV